MLEIRRGVLLHKLTFIIRLLWLRCCCCFCFCFCWRLFMLLFWFHWGNFSWVTNWPEGDRLQMLWFEVLEKHEKDPIATGDDEGEREEVGDDEEVVAVDRLDVRGRWHRLGLGVGVGGDEQSLRQSLSSRCWWWLLSKIIGGLRSPVSFPTLWEKELRGEESVKKSEREKRPHGVRWAAWVSRKEKERQEKNWHECVNKKEIFQNLLQPSLH